MSKTGSSKGEPTQTITPSGREVLLFNDHIYSELRALAGVPDDFTNSGWSYTADFSGGGGKGGTLMARIGAQYIIKELSPGDHKVLLDITPAYSEHIKGAESLLCPTYLHFKDVESGRLFFAMRNTVGAGELTALYDLKGCADDKAMVLEGQKIEAVHKRLWNVGMWCSKSGWTPARKKYYEGKVHARTLQLAIGTKAQRDTVVTCIKRDCDFLARLRLMDYSLIVAIKQGPSGSAGGAGPSAGQRPLVRKGPDGQDIAVHVSIIDFLQAWTTGKKVARVVKCAECNKATIPPRDYASRFARHFELRFSAFADGEAGTAASKESAPVPSMSIAPPAGDGDTMPQPEERLVSREMPAEQLFAERPHESSDAAVTQVPDAVPENQAV